MTVLNCPTGTIAPYTPSAAMPWNKKRILHLYRRMGFGADNATIEAALSQTPSDIIDNIIDEAIAMPVDEAPEWSNWNQEDYSEDFGEEASQQYFEWAVQWATNMLQRGFREKLTLFWSNHFVAKWDAYICGSYLYSYHIALQQHALGNFKDFTSDIGKTSAMLVFLNGVQNTRFEPNENYARELYELFTLGQDNGYTQQDIVETARALTGFQNITTYCDPIGFLAVTHDPGQKTIFEQTGNWNYNDVIDILFEHRAEQVAQHVCSKIYKYFVKEELDEEIIAEMAVTFQENDFEIAPVLRQLFKSEHFFSEPVMGVRVKSPIEWFLVFMKEAELPPLPSIMEAVVYLCFNLGQQLYSPIDVAGWPGNRTWINSSRLTGRWQGLDLLNFAIFENLPEMLRDVAKNIVGGDSTDPYLVSELIIDHLLTNGLQTADEYNSLAEAFKGEVPQNYYDNGEWNLDWPTVPGQVATLLYYVYRRPEYQLS